MTPHFHIGGLEMIAFMLHLLIAMFVLRGLAAWLIARNDDSRLGRAIGAVVS